MLGRTLVLVLFSSLCVSTAAARSKRVEFRLSRIHGLVDFVETLAKVPSRNRRLAKIFRASPFDTPEARAAIARYEGLSRLLHRGGVFAGYPSGRPVGMSVAQIIQTQAAHSRTLKELESRMLGLMPAGAHATLMAILRLFEPIYGRLIWKPNLAKLKRYRRRLLVIARRANVDALFGAAVRFYRASWPEKKRFTVALFPIPGARGYSTAYSMVSVESVGVLVDEEDIASRFGVIFHELCHSLWDAQSVQVQYELERAFRATKGPHARLAYQTLNEALATALGNGWAYLRATGREDTGSWYNDSYIDGFAKELSPLVRAALGEKKGLGANFVAKAVAAYAKRFPQGHRDWHNVLRTTSIFADGKSLGAGGVRKALFRHFKVYSLRASAPLTHPKSLSNLRRARGAVVVAAGSDRLAELAALARHYPPVDRYLLQLKKAGEGLAVGYDTKKRPFVLLVVRADVKRLDAAFAKLKATKLVPEKGAFFPF